MNILHTNMPLYQKKDYVNSNDAGYEMVEDMFD